MKKNYLHLKYAGNIWLLMMVCGFLLTYPFPLKSQTTTYPSDNGHIVGTTDSRMAATIVETDTTVTMKVFVVGEVRADAINFAFFFNPNVLFLTDSTQTKNLETAIGNNGQYPELNGAVKIDQALQAKLFTYGSIEHRDTGNTCSPYPSCSYNSAMRVFMPQIHVENPTLNTILTTEPHQIKPVYTCYFKKKKHSVPLKSEDIGIATKKPFLGDKYASKWAFDGMELVYNTSYTGITEISDSLVLFRSASSIGTTGVYQSSKNAAIFQGTFKTGNFPNLDNLLNLNTQTTTGTGRLHGDVILEYGFIYADFNAEITTKEFTDSLFINNVAYQSPTATEIAAHTFTRGGNTFHITTVTNSNQNQTVPYHSSLYNLTAPKYWIWSFMNYKFETSNPFPAVGNKLDLELNPCNLSISSIYIETQPTCNTTGSIRINVGGGGNDLLYGYSIDGSYYIPFYGSNLISGLSAGTYRIYVQEANNSSCPTVVSEPIVLEAADAELVLDVTTTNADACGSTTGSLTISVSGGDVASYQYRLNKGAWTDMSSPLTINNLTPGKYIVEIRDAQNCVVSCGEKEIKTQPDAGLEVNVASTNATCTTSNGTLTLMVIGNSTYKYQIVGGPILPITGNSVMLNNLPAGTYAWRVIDQAGCYTEGVREILNSDNPTFTVTISDIRKADCSGITGGGFTIHVNGTESSYQYSLNGGKTYYTMSGATHTINSLASGVYKVKVKDNTGCTYEYQYIRIDKGGNPTAPAVQTPQTFCSGATIAHLQADGLNIRWYENNEGGVPLTNTFLVNGNIYYASQTSNGCESEKRTAVKVIIDDEAIWDAPNINSPQNFCVSATIADIATNGNTNIVWYETPTGENTLSLSEPLMNGNSYYAAIKAGSCQSAVRMEVVVTIQDILPNAPIINSPQHFCEGALLANVSVPNNQIKWYVDATTSVELPAGTVLQNTTYYAAQKTGQCESSARTQVEIIIDQFPIPLAQDIQAFCSDTYYTLADLQITGSGIVWYATEASTVQLPLTTPLTDSTTYYAAQSSKDCEGVRKAIKVTFNCFTLLGTVFPFVHEADTAFNDQFPVIAKLYMVPPKDGSDPVENLKNATPLYITKAQYYDGSVYIPGTPKNPGQLSVTNNPGLPILWSEIGKTQGIIDNTPVSGIGDVPTTPIGMYKFEEVAPGEYILELSRSGFLLRWAKITVTGDQILGHRELLPGDVNNDLIIDSYDMSRLNAKYTNSGAVIYDPTYDFNADGVIQFGIENLIIRFNISARIIIYEETSNFLETY